MVGFESCTAAGSPFKSPAVQLTAATKRLVVPSHGSPPNVDGHPSIVQLFLFLHSVSTTNWLRGALQLDSLKLLEPLVALGVQWPVGVPYDAKSTFEMRSTELAHFRSITSWTFLIKGVSAHCEGGLGGGGAGGAGVISA